MTIHHDKLAYGKLSEDSEQLTEEQILLMLSTLNKESKVTNPKTDQGNKIKNKQNKNNGDQEN